MINRIKPHRGEVSWRVGFRRAAGGLQETGPRGHGRLHPRGSSLGCKAKGLAGTGVAVKLS